MIGHQHENKRIRTHKQEDLLNQVNTTKSEAMAASREFLPLPPTFFQKIGLTPSGIYAKNHIQIMLLFVYTTTRKRL